MRKDLLDVTEGTISYSIHNSVKAVFSLCHEYCLVGNYHEFVYLWIFSLWL